MIGEKKIRLLIVDDSKVVRRVLSEIFSLTNDIEVVGQAVDPYDALDKIKQLNPDVLTLDIEMPRMDGITFLSKLMRVHPMPVVMVSALTEKGAAETFRALELGAVDFIAKPKGDKSVWLASYSQEIRYKVRGAYKARIRPVSVVEKGGALVAVESIVRTNSRQIIAIGSSTGGTEAIKEILINLPVDSPPIVISQHIPKKFSGPFAQRLDGLCDLTVVEATDGMPINSGYVYIAPGDHHLVIEDRGAGFVCALNNDLMVNSYTPSVDVMFLSLLLCAPRDVLAVMLTGMGSDGAKGMLELRNAGAKTIAQDEATSVVWGMPGSAVKLSAVQTVLPLKKIANHLISQFE
ncbi:MAG: two-component system chemotaxis response regulator CheB [Cycloclasticus sp.]|jgi:two-component system chemotaxis response regulator CheB